MASRYQRRAATQTPELILSDSEDAYDSSEDEGTEQEQVDQLLKQAHHYVITEGGNDSPTTYIERIQRIDRSLLREIVKHDYDCDRKLYRAVKHKIDHVQREFEDTVDADSSVHDYEEMPEYYTAAAGEALRRIDSSPVTPDAPVARRKTKATIKDELERTYLYGGPGNYPEYWHNKAPASLLFPETIRMADWESLRIHWDLKTTGDMEITEPVTSNGVSFNNPLLAHHNSLAQYESGSRFRLPAIQPSDMAMVNELGTPDSLRKAVEAFGQRDDTKKENGDYKYAPRVFLETLRISHQTSTQDLVGNVRSALNTTPTRRRAGSSGSSKIGSAAPSNDALLNKQQQASEDSISRTIETDDSGGSSVVRTAIQINKIPSRTTTLESSSRNTRASSPAMRRIKAATEAAIRSSPQPQSPPMYIETTLTKLATQASTPAKEHSGGLRKNLVSATTVPAYQSTQAGTKRKRLNTDDNYEPPAVEVAINGEVVQVEERPAKRKRTTPKPTHGRYPSVRELRRSETQPSTPSAIEASGTPALTPASTGTSVASTPPVVKASVAGKQKRRIRTKRDPQERVTPEEYDEVIAECRKGLGAEGYESVVTRSMRSGKVRGT